MSKFKIGQKVCLKKDIDGLKKGTTGFICLKPNSAIPGYRVLINHRMYKTFSEHELQSYEDAVKDSLMYFMEDLRKEITQTQFAEGDFKGLGSLCDSPPPIPNSHQIKPCMCTINQLMWGGCICGGFESEQRAKKGN